MTIVSDVNRKYGREMNPRKESSFPKTSRTSEDFIRVRCHVTLKSEASPCISLTREANEGRISVYVVHSTVSSDYPRPLPLSERYHKTVYN